MVTRNMKIVESDISGEPGAETTLLGIKGEVLELDMTPAERAALEEVLAPYVARGRKLGPMSAKPSTPRRVPQTTPEERAEIRAWAKAEGYEVADHGQIPNAVVTAYRAAHSETVEGESPAA
ncbi:Lsr2 family protein [Nostocoides vanveenii]|uniref:Lsr2 family protein n=1 Tax=Nostocoides vanveenii TaxID=330835 RepID=A0ABP4X3B6_9MICO